jgi:hypothetical protein
MNSDGHRTRTLPLIVVLGVTTAFDAMAIDLYLRASATSDVLSEQTPARCKHLSPCSSAEPLSDNFSTDP